MLDKSLFIIHQASKMALEIYPFLINIILLKGYYQNSLLVPFIPEEAKGECQDYFSKCFSERKVS